MPWCGMKDTLEYKTHCPKVSTSDSFCLAKIDIKKWQEKGRNGFWVSVREAVLLGLLPGLAEMVCDGMVLNSSLCTYSQLLQLRAGFSLHPAVGKLNFTVVR